MIVKKVSWSNVKSERLKRTRGVSFEEIITSRLIDIREHPVRKAQKILVYGYRGYVWAVPCVEDDSGIFLKTLYPSRKLMKIYNPG